MLKLATKENVAVTRHSSITSLVLPTESNIRESAFRYCREFLHGSWRNIQFSDMAIHKISGGLSNLLYCCELPKHIPVLEDEPRKVLVRFYGPVNCDRALETLITECVILTLLSERQRGPRLYGIFHGGRLEEYVPARPLLTSELAHPNLSCRIAEKMATIHLMDVPMNKQPTHIWQSMERWAERIDDLVQQDSPDTAVSAVIIQKLRGLNIKNELAWLREFVEQISSPVVFCHNDMTEGNILLRYKENKGCTEPILDQVTADDLVVIDFEYCCYNKRGYDIANHFLEWMYDYNNDCQPYFWSRPTKDHASPGQKERFVRAYLTALKESPAYRKRPEDTTENIMKEIEFYTLVSHFFWALWSVVSNTTMFTSTGEFDYWCYGERRFEAYYSHKRKLQENFAW